jgi:O-glycosyl hydrolase
MRELARRYGLHLWMTEYESPDYTDWSHSLDWAQRMHTLLTTGGVNAIDYLWAFYGSWTRPATMVSIDFDNGVYRSFELTPVYWITGQYSRFVRPGYRRVQSSPEQGSVETTAFTGAGRVVVVCVNPSGSPQAVRLLIHGGRIARTASAVRSSPTEHWRTLPIVPVRNGAFAVTLQAESVTTFIVRRS